MPCAHHRYNRRRICPASEARWELMKNHPSDCEIALATERMNERIQLLEILQGKGIAFPSIQI